MVNLIQELSEVFIFCGFYSGVVIFSLWMTASESIKGNRKLQFK